VDVGRLVGVGDDVAFRSLAVRRRAQAAVPFLEHERFWPGRLVFARRTIHSAKPSSRRQLRQTRVVELVHGQRAGWPQLLKMREDCIDPNAHAHCHNPHSVGGKRLAQRREVDGVYRAESEEVRAGRVRGDGGAAAGQVVEKSRYGWAGGRDLHVFLARATGQGGPGSLPHGPISLPATTAWSQSAARVGPATPRQSKIEHRSNAANRCAHQR